MYFARSGAAADRRHRRVSARRMKIAGVSTPGVLWEDLTQGRPKFQPPLRDLIFCGFIPALKCRAIVRGSVGTGYGTERMRQKLLVVGSGVLVKTSAPSAPAGLVNCGIQLITGNRLNVRSSA
jgi:hypothetical protein